MQIFERADGKDLGKADRPCRGEAEEDKNQWVMRMDGKDYTWYDKIGKKDKAEGGA